MAERPLTPKVLPKVGVRPRPEVGAKSRPEGSRAKIPIPKPPIPSKAIIRAPVKVGPRRAAKQRVETDIFLKQFPSYPTSSPGTKYNETKVRSYDPRLYIAYYELDEYFGLSSHTIVVNLPAYAYNPQIASKTLPIALRYEEKDYDDADQYIDVLLDKYWPQDEFKSYYQLDKARLLPSLSIGLGAVSRHLIREKVMLRFPEQWYLPYSFLKTVFALLLDPSRPHISILETSFTSPKTWLVALHMKATYNVLITREEDVPTIEDLAIELQTTSDDIALDLPVGKYDLILYRPRYFGISGDVNTLINPNKWNDNIVRDFNSYNKHLNSGGYIVLDAWNIQPHVTDGSNRFYYNVASVMPLLASLTDYEYRGVVTYGIYQNMEDKYTPLRGVFIYQQIVR